MVRKQIFSKPQIGRKPMNSSFFELAECSERKNENALVQTPRFAPTCAIATGNLHNPSRESRSTEKENESKSQNFQLSGFPSMSSSPSKCILSASLSNESLKVIEDSSMEWQGLMDENDIHVKCRDASNTIEENQEVKISTKGSAMHYTPKPPTTTKPRRSSAQRMLCRRNTILIRDSKEDIYNSEKNKSKQYGLNSTTTSSLLIHNGDSLSCFSSTLSSGASTQETNLFSLDLGTEGSSSLTLSLNCNEKNLKQAPEKKRLSSDKSLEETESLPASARSSAPSSSTSRSSNYSYESIKAAYSHDTKFWNRLGSPVDQQMEPEDEKTEIEDKEEAPKHNRESRLAARYSVSRSFVPKLKNQENNEWERRKTTSDSIRSSVIYSKNGGGTNMYHMSRLRRLPLSQIEDTLSTTSSVESLSVIDHAQQQQQRRRQRQRPKQPDKEQHQLHPHQRNLRRPSGALCLTIGEKFGEASQSTRKGQLVSGFRRHVLACRSP